MSVTAPGGQGFTIVIGLLGKSSAAAAPQTVSAIAMPTHVFHTRAVMSVSPVTFLWGVRRRYFP
jgi:hypothetical protein